MAQYLDRFRNFLPPWPRMWLEVPELRDEDRADPTLHQSILAEREAYAGEDNELFLGERYGRTVDHVAWPARRQAYHRQLVRQRLEADTEARSFPELFPVATDEQAELYARKHPENAMAKQLIGENYRALIGTAAAAQLGVPILFGIRKTGTWVAGFALALNVFVLGRNNILKVTAPNGEKVDLHRYESFEVANRFRDFMYELEKEEEGKSA